MEGLALIVVSLVDADIFLQPLALVVASGDSIYFSARRLA